MNLKISKDEFKSMLEQTEKHRAEMRALPGYAEVLAETIAENDAARIARQIAAKSKLTQKQIAKRMNVSQPRVSQIANGEDLSLSTLYRYAAACGARLRITATF